MIHAFQQEGGPHHLKAVDMQKHDIVCENISCFLANKSCKQGKIGSTVSFCFSTSSTINTVPNEKCQQQC